MKKVMAVIAVFLVVFIIFVFSFKVYDIEQNVKHLQQDINLMNLHSQSVTQSEYTQAIDFLENEIIKYREFVEKQQDYLILLIGLIGTALTGMFAFFEIRGRKDISNIIREQYTNQAQEEIAKFIGGQNKITYLISCIEKEEQAKNKKIIFLMQHKVNKNLVKVYKILKSQHQYQIKKKRISGMFTDRDINHWVDENDIIIYQVDELEFKRNGFVPDEQVAYARLSKECNNKKVYCILYCAKNNVLEPSLYNSYFYISNANYGLTVMERIFNLLYFA